jgi:SAM-dependent methyltransferase
MPDLSRTVYRSLRTMVSRLCEGRREYYRLQVAMTELLVAAAACRQPHSVLDIGCGEGGYTLNNAQALGISESKIYGIELNRAHLEIARQRFVAFGIDVEQEQIPLADASVELVICNQVLEHLKNVFWALAEMDRVLAVGGILALGIPNLTSFINRPVLLWGRQPITIGLEGPHVRAFAHASFRAFLLRHSGYRLVAEMGSSLYPWPAGLGAERFARRLPGLAAYTFYALVKQAAVMPCPWLKFGADGETSYSHVLPVPVKPGQ